MKKLWIRIGAEITLTDEEFEESVNNNHKLEQIIEDKVTSGQYTLSGETYAPECIGNVEYINDLIDGNVEILL